MGEIALVTAWVEEHVGGRVVAAARQPRWRPVWFVDVERDGEVLELCVRGDRTDFPGIFPLKYEMRCQQLLEQHGIPVPHVYGWIDEPRAFVCDRVGGANDFADATEAERDAAVDDYIDILARMHALDVEPFVRGGVARDGMSQYLRHFRATKKRPDPFMEFCLGWLDRHPVDTRGRESMVVWDSGQFHHRDGKIVAVLDVELAHIGDPMMDLAAFRMRDTIVGYGDFGKLYARYEELSGTPVDLDAIRLHHIAFTLTNQLAFHAAMAEPPPGSDYMTNMQWAGETNLFAVEAIADELGIELQPVAMPDPVTTLGAIGHAHLVSVLRNFPVADEFAEYERRAAFRLARHLQRLDQVGAQVADADLDDLASLLGHRPDTWQEGDAALERFVLADNGRHDDELVVLFHRRLWRFHQLLGPAGSAMTTHLPIQRFV